MKIQTETDEGTPYLIGVGHGKTSMIKNTRASRQKRTFESGASHHSEEELVQYQYKLLSTLLQRLVTQRSPKRSSRNDSAHLKNPLRRIDSMVVDEITEVVQVKESDFNPAQADLGSESSVSGTDEPVMSDKVHSQLKSFIKTIGSMYHKKNPFHCFDHASHVTFSAYQLLRKTAAQDLPKSPVSSFTASDFWNELPASSMECKAASALANDPLAQFAIIFSALIHDVDHVGVPNFVLAKEKPDVAAKYQNRSLAEQTSVDVAWNLLEQDSFHDLKAAIFPSKDEYNRFRAMVVNIVMATDAFDVTLRNFRDQKWEKAFESPPECAKEHINRKATVMMDLIMMSSDISHTMQSFDVYCEWNGRLFKEMYAAYCEGRSDKDPSEGWVNGELIFFDKHIIPLASRIQESGMFGATATAMLQNAHSNRQQWKEKGKGLFDALLKKVKQSEDSQPVRKKSRTARSA